MIQAKLDNIDKQYLFNDDRQNLEKKLSLTTGAIEIKPNEIPVPEGDKKIIYMYTDKSISLGVARTLEADNKCQFDDIEQMIPVKKTEMKMHRREKNSKGDVSTTVSFVSSITITESRESTQVEVGYYNKNHQISFEKLNFSKEQYEFFKNELLKQSTGI